MSKPPKDDQDDLSDPGCNLWPEPEDGPQPDYDPGQESPNEDQDALEGHVPYDDGAKEPGPTDFDPMAKSVWTWFMALAWIGWRTPEHVRRCSEDYRANSWRYGSRTVVLPVKPRKRLGQMSVEKRVWGNDGPMNGLTLTNMEVASLVKPEISIADAERLLKNALVEGRLAATAADGVSGEPVQIDKFKWAHIEVNDSGELYSRKAPGKIAYNDLRIMRSEVMNLWPKSSEDEQIGVNPSSGAPGRPTSMHLVVAEFRRRLHGRIAVSSNTAESELLKEWFDATHPIGPRLTAKTIRNKIGPIRRAFEAAQK